jgi:hypothetical protein
MARVKSNGFAGLVIPFALAACLIGGYWFYWAKAAAQIETRVLSALPVSAASSVKVTGFPYRLTLEIGKLNLGNPNGLRFTAAKLRATATPFNPLLWALESAQEPALGLPGDPIRPLKATNLKASLRLSQSGLERFSLTFDGLAGQRESGAVDGGWKVGSGKVHILLDPKNNDSLAMVTELNAIVIDKPLAGPGAILGQTINRVFTSGPINQAQALMRSPDAWRDAGGAFTIMSGQVLWGPVALTNATGNLSLSSTGKWQGTLAGQGALKPDGIPVSALSAPVALELKEGRVSLRGLPGVDLSNLFE